MDIAAIQSMYGATPTAVNNGTSVTAPQGFDSMLNSVMELLKDTNSLQQAAQNEEMAFSLGETQNTHDLMIAQQKANVALQYTVAVRDSVIGAYNTIINMQI
ncbi:MAG: flagellar hook-basal body complex protein FliE [Pseudobutyrivibrio sp.]|nr:flagellar hook-basal body complex protein FliE [Pseudobutyrivibrio sp.]